MKVALGADHAGVGYKARVARWLEARGHSVTDFGTGDAAPVDYPRFVRPVAEAVARGDADRGIVLGGSGNGEAMAANRVRGVRCALCWSAESARLSRAHNDANVLALGERLLDWSTVERILEAWFATPFDGGRHARRIALLDE
jgi:ribose 5-phosphate isomerase B